MTYARNTLIVLACLLTVAGCRDWRWQDPETRSVAIGASAGVITAALLDADPAWIIIAGLAGAAVGSIVARNDETDQCAYVRRDRYYDVRPCN